MRMLLLEFMWAKLSSAAEEHGDAGSGGSPPPTCSDSKIDRAICRVELRDGGSPVAIKIWEISVPSLCERGDDSQVIDAEVGNFSPGTRVLCNFIRCWQMGPSMERVDVFLPPHCSFAAHKLKISYLFRLCLSLSFCCSLPPWALCHWNLRPKGLKDCVLWLCHAETLLFMTSLMCGKFEGRDVGLKEEENCFIDAFYFFGSCFLSVCFVSCRTLPSFPCPDSLIFSFLFNHEDDKRLLLPSWFLLFSPPCWGGQAQPLLSLCPWDRTAWSLCPSPHEPFVLVKQALSVASEPVFSQSWFLWVRNNGDWFGI